MFFRILLISLISWAVLKFFRYLTGKKKRPSGPFQRNTRRKPYEGRAVDAQFEEVDDPSGARNDD
jgi:hypothetical protein